jgi:16S rRNA (guanine527-N7)-methyltransferase
MVWKDRKEPSSLIDVGTGAGFPGLVLKIVMPELRLTLVESIGKKVSFCSHVVEVLGLKQVTIIQNRAEIVGHDILHREKYDCAIARAVAHLSTLSEYLLPFVNVGGIMVAQKGAVIDQEVSEAQNAINILGGGIIKCIPVLLPGDSFSRQLLVSEKLTPTPEPYPRESRLLLAQPL